MSPGSFPIGSFISHGQSNPASKITIPIIIKVRCKFWFPLKVYQKAHHILINKF
jgi:hypothetical protein